MVALVSVLAMTGCPSEFGKDGRVDRAIEQDTHDQFLFIKGCTKAQFKEVCTADKWDSDECKKCRQAGVQ
ncbi:MAG TPA: hypothetical protein VF815_37465 [Myxococcaceae bacterium]|jgi:hypothetical protein